MKDKKQNACVKVSETLAGIKTSQTGSPEKATYSTVNIPEAIQEAFRKAGALHAAEFFKTTSLALQFEIITDAKKKELHKKNGFPNFSTFCEKVFNISKTRAHEILNFEKKLGHDALIAMAHIGLRRKDILSLAENAELNTSSNITVIIDGDEEIPLTPENKDRIQKIADSLKKAEVENMTLKQRIQELKKGDVETESFETTMTEISMNMVSIYQPLKQMKAIAKTDPALKRLYISNLIKMETWFANVKDELLDEDLGEMEDIDEEE